MPRLIRQSELARRLKLSRAWITQLVHEGVVELNSRGLVDYAQAKTAIERRRDRRRGCQLNLRLRVDHRQLADEVGRALEDLESASTLLLRSIRGLQDILKNEAGQDLGETPGSEKSTPNGDTPGPEDGSTFGDENKTNHELIQKDEQKGRITS